MSQTTTEYLWPTYDILGWEGKGLKPFAGSIRFTKKIKNNSISSVFNDISIVKCGNFICYNSGQINPRLWLITITIIILLAGLLL